MCRDEDDRRSRRVRTRTVIVQGPCFAARVAAYTKHLRLMTRFVSAAALTRIPALLLARPGLLERPQHCASSPRGPPRRLAIPRRSPRFAWGPSPGFCGATPQRRWRALGRLLQGSRSSTHRPRMLPPLSARSAPSQPIHALERAIRRTSHRRVPAARRLRPCAPSWSWSPADSGAGSDGGTDPT